MEYGDECCKLFLEMRNTDLVVNTENQIAEIQSISPTQVPRNSQIPYVIWLARVMPDIFAVQVISLAYTHGLGLLSIRGIRLKVVPLVNMNS